MKIMTLNLWGGRVYEPLVAFLLKNQDVDVFCFQEIYHNATNKPKGDSDENTHFELYDEIQSILKEYTGCFCPTVGDYYGIATFIKNDIKMIGSGDITIYSNPEYLGHGGAHDRKVLWTDLETEDGNISVLNVHGLWNGRGKTDTPDRIEQSKQIRKLMDSIKGTQIVCGDFNLLPNTESISILEKGMKNLIKEYSIETTRTSFYTRAETSGKFADYMFTSNDTQVLDFKVLPDEVSDHAALLLEVKIA